MKNSLVLISLFFALQTGLAQQSLNVLGLKWENSYTFDKCNVMRIEFYGKDSKLMKTNDYKTHFQSNGENFSIVGTNPKGNDRAETIIDKKNEVAIQIYRMGNTTALCNAGGYKNLPESELKKLELVPTEEIKQICGLTCKKFTYTYKKIFGECWITDQIVMPNDYGIFRAAKMSAIHNTLSVGGFVMEMTTQDAKGGKTLMTTISLNNSEAYTTDFKNDEMTTSVNRVSYFAF